VGGGWGCRYLEAMERGGVGSGETRRGGYINDSSHRHGVLFFS